MGLTTSIVAVTMYMHVITRAVVLEINALYRPVQL